MAVFITGGGVAPKVGDENTLLLLHCEEIKDNSLYGNSIENTGVVVSSDQSKFGGKSLYFGGNLSHLTIKQNFFDFKSNDFTFDWWEYCTQNHGSRFALSIAGGCGGICAGGSGSSNLLYVSSNGTQWDLANGITGLSNQKNSWVHCAVVRSVSQIMVFKNGTIVNSSSIPVNSNVFFNNTGLVIGSFLYDTTHDFVGYIDEFRVSNVARWTNNFTPPTEPYRW